LFVPEHRITGGDWDASGGERQHVQRRQRNDRFNGTTLSYDANGNLTGDGINTYTWDAGNRLTAISGGATASFVYDAFGRRMSKTVGGTVTQFMYDRFNPVQELNSSGGVTANLLTGLRIDEYFTRTASSTTSTLLTDALGSTIGLVASSGTIATSYTYQPFGGTTAGGAGNTNPYQFTGRENDGTGLYFYRARYYSPTFQRFVSQDPIGFRGGSPNVYAYVLNAPTIMIDLLGLDGALDSTANILFNETSILSGPGLFDARMAIAHTLQNGLNDPSGPPVHAPDTSPDQLSLPAQRTMIQCVQAAAQAADDSSDPTHGADHYIMVDPNSNFPASRQPIPYEGDPRYGVEQVFGPFTAGPGGQVSGSNVFIIIFSGP